MSLYLDTSCLLKLVFPEPETERVAEIVASEEHVVVSTLARLEAFVQLHARHSGGTLSAADAKALMKRIDVMLEVPPWEVVRAPSDVVDLAEQTVRAFPRKAYSATLDRLHLATMKALGITRLLTNDAAQATAARQLRFEVTLPR